MRPAIKALREAGFSKGTSLKLSPDGRRLIISQGLKYFRAKCVGMTRKGREQIVMLVVRPGA